MSDLVVQVEGLNVCFGDFFAVKNVSFNVRRGEIFGFLGANGAGKTTTIRILCGVLAPTSGNVKVCGKSFADGAAAIKARVGYMSQKFTLYDDLSIGENLDFAAALRKLSTEQYHARRKELFELIALDRPLNTLVKDLPGGLKQQVSLVASLLHRPEIVFLDEPTAGVTPASRKRFWDLIKRLSKAGTTVFVTTHYMDEAEQCERIALMRAGGLIALDSPVELKRAAFPHGLKDLEPRGVVSNALLSQLKEHPAVGLLEPYGMRYHLEVVDSSAFSSLEIQIKENFQVTAIEPSLEDVFIRLVEGKNR